MVMSRRKNIVLTGVILALVTAFAAYYFLPRDDMRMVELMRILQLPRKDIEDMSMEEFSHIMQVRAQRMRIRLLYETDHKTLLLACRKISKKKAAGILKSQRYNVLSEPHPEAAKFPRAILDLEPSYVFIDYDGRIMVEMMGGLDHFGVQAYPEGYKKSSQETLGDKKLIDGLWYYDDGYLVRPEDYEKRIEALRPKVGEN